MLFDFSVHPVSGFRVTLPTTDISGTAIVWLEYLPVTAPKLRITIMGLNYAPEPTGIAPYTTKLAEGLRREGHEVLVLTGYPHYPQWKLQPGYLGWSAVEVHNDVRVRRLRHSIPSRVTTTRRIHMELSFGVRLFFANWGQPDVVIAITPALFATALVMARSKITRRTAGTGIWVQDVYSRGLEETGTGASRAVNLMKCVEGWVLRSADRVSVIHDRFKEYLSSELAVSQDNIRVIRNWTHTTASDEKVMKDDTRQRYGWGPKDVIVLHAGNMGIKQGLENVVDAARLAEERQSNVKFVLLGDGNQRQKLQDRSQGLTRIEFIPPVADKEFKEILASADILLVNEMPGLREMAVPSKLTSYFGSGIPVIAATDTASTTAGEIRASNGGVVVEPGQPISLLKAVEDLNRDEALASAMGAAGRVYATNTLSQEAAIVFYTDWVENIADSRDVGRSQHKLFKTT